MVYNQPVDCYILFLLTYRAWSWDMMVASICMHTHRASSGMKMRQISEFSPFFLGLLEFFLVEEFYMFCCKRCWGVTDQKTKTKKRVLRSICFYPLLCVCVYGTDDDLLLLLLLKWRLMAMYVLISCQIGLHYWVVM